jgi:hypothetical protein
MKRQLLNETDIERIVCDYLRDNLYITVDTTSASNDPEDNARLVYVETFLKSPDGTRYRICTDSAIL